MLETRSKKNPIVGYMGYVPSNEGQELEEGGKIGDSHVPGYVGYIPAVKSENLYAKTYGKITENCNRGNFHKGIELPNDVKYTSTTKETYVNPNIIKEQETAEGKISGVKATTFSNAAKYIICDSDGWSIPMEQRKSSVPKKSQTWPTKRPVARPTNDPYGHIHY